MIDLSILKLSVLFEMFKDFLVSKIRNLTFANQKFVSLGAAIDKRFLYARRVPGGCAHEVPGKAKAAAKLAVASVSRTRRLS